MFKLQPAPKFWNEVEIGGGTFKMEYRHVDRIILGRWLKDVRAIKSEDQEQAIREELALFMEVCVGWDIEGEEFSEDNMAELLSNYIGAGGAIVESFTTGLREGQAKN